MQKPGHTGFCAKEKYKQEKERPEHAERVRSLSSGCDRSFGVGRLRLTWRQWGVPECASGPFRKTVAREIVCLQFRQLDAVLFCSHQRLCGSVGCHLLSLPMLTEF